MSVLAYGHKTIAPIKRKNLVHSINAGIFLVEYVFQVEHCNMMNSSPVPTGI
jgi:hypothetical protein